MFGVASAVALRCVGSTPDSVLCGALLVMEATLELRAVRELAAVTRARGRVAVGCSAIGVLCDVQWDALQGSKTVQKSSKYVRIIDDAAAKVIGMLAGASYGFSNLSLLSELGASLVGSDLCRKNKGPIKC